MSLKSFKKCADCEKSFRPYKSTDKYCSPKCALKHFKPLKSKPKIYKPKIKPTKSDNFKKEFDKQRKKIKNNLIKKYGLLICEKCGTIKTIQFSTHHIIFRSETPSHPELNNLLNLIHLCYDCHESFHTIKISRNYLIKERNLNNLFGNIWGYE